MWDVIQKLYRHEGLARYAGNSAWPFLEKGVRLAFGVTVGLWIIRYLGPEQFGLLSYAQSFNSFFVVISVFGLDLLLIRELAGDEGDPNAIMGTAFVLKFAGSLISIAMTYAVAVMIGETTEARLLIVIVSSVSLFRAFDVLNEYFYYRVMSKYPVLSAVISVTLISASRIYLIVYEYPLEYFAVALVGEISIISICSYIFYKRRIGSITHWRFSVVRAKQFLRDCWPIIVSGILVTVYMKTDQIMLEKMLGHRDVGLYAASAKIIEIFCFIPYAITLTLFPAILNAKKSSEESYLLRLQRLYDFILLIALLVVVPTVLFSDYVIPLVYDQRFTPAAKVLKVHVLSLFLLWFVLVRSKWMIVENLQKYDLAINMIGAVVNVALNFVLIKSYGIVGAAYATLLSQLCSLLLSSLLIRPIRPSFFMALTSLKNILFLKFLRRNYYHL